MLTGKTGGLLAPASFGMEETMQVRILSGTVANGAIRRIGELVDVPEREARLLINSGKAAEQETDTPKPKGRPKKTKAPVNRMDQADVAR